MTSSKHGNEAGSEKARREKVQKIKDAGEETSQRFVKTSKHHPEKAKHQGSTHGHADESKGRK